MFERTFLVELNDNVRLVRTHPKQLDGRLKYYLHRSGEDEAWVPCAGERQPTAHVLGFARERLLDEVVEQPISENQTRLGDFDDAGGGVQNGG